MIHLVAKLAYNGSILSKNYGITSQNPIKELIDQDAQDVHDYYVFITEIIDADFVEKLINLNLVSITTNNNLMVLSGNKLNFISLINKLSTGSKYFQVLAEYLKPYFPNSQLQLRN